MNPAIPCPGHLREVPQRSLSAAPRTRRLPSSHRGMSPDLAKGLVATMPRMRRDPEILVLLSTRPFHTRCGRYHRSIHAGDVMEGTQECRRPRETETGLSGGHPPGTDDGVFQGIVRRVGRNRPCWNKPECAKQARYSGSPRDRRSPANRIARTAVRAGATTRKSSGRHRLSDDAPGTSRSSCKARSCCPG